MKTENYIPDFDNFNSMFELISFFNDEKKCEQFITANRWGNNVICPYCGHEHCYTRTDGRFKCRECNSNFSCKVGTIFDNTKIPLLKWFMAMYLISCHKKGVSSVQLSVDIKVSQKSAWHILQKIRTLFTQDDSIALKGDVECDEMYLGGRETNKHQSKRTEGTQGRSTKTKTPIFGMVERFGNAVVMQVPDTKASTLKAIIEQFIAGGSHIFTDEYQAYRGLGEKYTHSVIQHGAREFSKENVSTNSIEGFWGHFKRMVFGTYHFVSKRYLQRYIDEAVYRWNTQVYNEGERFSVMLSKAIGICRYDDVKMVA